MANIFRPHKIITNKSNTITITRNADGIKLTQQIFYISAFLFFTSPVVIVAFDITLGIILCATSCVIAILFYGSFSSREQIHIDVSNGTLKYDNKKPIKYNYKDALLTDIDFILTTSELSYGNTSYGEEGSPPILFYDSYIIWKQKNNRTRIDKMLALKADLNNIGYYPVSKNAEQPLYYLSHIKNFVLKNSKLIFCSTNEHLAWETTAHIAKILKLPLYDITHSNITSWEPEEIGQSIQHKRSTKMKFEETKDLPHSRHISVQYANGSFFLHWKDKIKCQLSEKHLIFNKTKINLNHINHLRSHIDDRLVEYSIKVITNAMIYSFNTYDDGVAEFIIARIEHYFAKEISPFTIYGTYRDKGSQDISHWDKEISCKEFISTMNTGLLVPDKESLLKAITYCFYNHGITSNKYINITDDSFSDLERRLLSAGYIQKSNANQKYYWNFTNTGKSLISSRS